MRHALSRIHFVGIGGAGMSGIAEVLHQQGFVVSGSDAHDSPALARLRQLGLRVHVGHAAAHGADAQAVVVSSAIAPDNPEVAAARARQLPVVPRAAMLAELMRARLGVAVAGTHGKTTTSSLLTHVLLAAGLDPGFVIGGQLLDAGVGARAGRGDVLVAEADESDASFLHLSPLLAVVTNIDADHMETYGHSLDRLHQAFIDFLHRLPFYGTAVVCGDDPGVQAIAARVQRPLLRVGLGEGMDLVARRLQPGPGARMHFVAEQSGHDPLPLSLALAGTHNVRNALAVLAVARLLGVPDGVTRQALASFGGVGRRFQHRGELRSADGGAATLIDDYGHHPMEVAAVLAAARGAYPGRRLVLAFQPHRYTRTRDCMDTFAAVLGQADVLWLTEVYAAGEEPIAGADGAALARAVRAADQVEPSFAADLDGLVEGLAGELRDGDVVLSLGAGSISALPDRLIRRLGTAQSETT